MKIQEMRSGILHLNKKMEHERQEKYETSNAGAWPVETEQVLPTAADSELDEPRWSVISFDKREAGALTYKQAAELMSQLDANGIAGLCIVTNEAAARVGS